MKHVHGDDGVVPVVLKMMSTRIITLWRYRPVHFQMARPRGITVMLASQLPRFMSVRAPRLRESPCLSQQQIKID